MLAIPLFSRNVLVMMFIDGVALRHAVSQLGPDPAQTLLTATVRSAREDVQGTPSAFVPPGDTVTMPLHFVWYGPELATATRHNQCFYLSDITYRSEHEERRGRTPICRQVKPRTGTRREQYSIISITTETAPLFTVCSGINAFERRRFKYKSSSRSHTL